MEKNARLGTKAYCGVVTVAELWRGAGGGFQGAEQETGDRNCSTSALMAGLNVTIGRSGGVMGPAEERKRGADRQLGCGGHRRSEYYSTQMTVHASGIDLPDWDPRGR